MKNKEYKTFIITGGTGGHIFPALSFSNYLSSKKINNLIITDYRGSKFIDKSKYNIRIIPSSHLNKKNIKFIWAIFTLFFGLIIYKFLFICKRPNNIITFGGYTSLIPIICSLIFKKIFNTKLYFHEQNAVIGRVHKFFLFAADKVFLTFKDTKEIKNKFLSKTFYVGLPMYKNTRNFKKTNFKIPSKFEKIKLLVFGGSQAASKLSESIVYMLTKLSINYQKLIYLTIQVPEKDIETIKTKLNNSEIEYEINTFYTDLLSKISRSHLCICRAGSSTINELIQLKAPSILVPLPSAVGNHQYYNAKFLSDKNGAIIIDEKDLLKKESFNILEKYILNPSSLRRMFTNLSSIDELDSNELMYNNIYNIN